MFLTILMAALAAGGVFLVLLTFAEALQLRPSHACHVIYLFDDRPDPIRLVQSCLRARDRGTLSGLLLFVDCGINARQQEAIALLLRGVDKAAVCSAEQVAEYWETERIELGAGTDQWNHCSRRF